MKKIIISLILLALPSMAFAEDNTDKALRLFINLTGNLCARVVSVHKLEVPDYYEVRCIEYRGGTGTVDYLVNFEEQKVIKR
nr:MAG TPA: exopolysaccharide production protein [Caudoviricetes sp.]